MIRLLAFLLVFLAGIAAVACGTNAGTTAAQQSDMNSKSLAHVDTGNNVTVEAVWMSQADIASLPKDLLKDYPPAQYILIRVKLDTHSVDLSQYDMVRLSVINGRSATPVAAEAWLGISDSSHHRDGILVFLGMGNAEWETQENGATLTVSNVAGIAQRTFEWQF